MFTWLRKNSCCSNIHLNSKIFFLKMKVSSFVPNKVHGWTQTISWSYRYWGCKVDLFWESQARDTTRIERRTEPLLRTIHGFSTQLRHASPGALFVRFSSFLLRWVCIDDSQPCWAMFCLDEWFAAKGEAKEAISCAKKLFIYGNITTPILTTPSTIFAISSSCLCCTDSN